MLQYISMWHVTHVAIHINVTRHTCCNTYQRNTSHMLQYISMWHVTHVAIHINATRHTCCNTYQCDMSHMLQYISMRYVTCVHESWMNHGTAIECTLNNHLRTTQQALKKHSTTTRVPLKYRTTQIQYHSNTVPLKYQSIVNNHPIHPPTLAKDLMSDLTHESASQMRHEWFDTLDCFTDETWVIWHIRVLHRWECFSHLMSDFTDENASHISPTCKIHPPTHPPTWPPIHPPNHAYTHTHLWNGVSEKNLSPSKPARTGAGTSPGMLGKPCGCMCVCRGIVPRPAGSASNVAVDISQRQGRGVIW